MKFMVVLAGLVAVTAAMMIEGMVECRRKGYGGPSLAVESFMVICGAECRDSKVGAREGDELF